MVHGSRGAVLLALSTTSIALFGVAAGSASAMSRATSAPDAKGDLVDQGEDPTPGSTTDPSRDIVSVSYNYNASGRVELSATMAAPVNPAQAPLAVDFTLNGPDANGHCQRGGAANQLAVRVDTSGHSGPAKLTVVKHFAIGDSTGEDPIPAVQQIDGTHVNAVVTSDKLANLDYVCLVVTSYATTSQNTGPPVDTAAAQIDGYFYQPGRESWTIGELRTPIQPKDKAAKIATILKSGRLRVLVWRAVGHSRDCQVCMDLEARRRGQHVLEGSLRSSRGPQIPPEVDEGRQGAAQADEKVDLADRHRVLHPGPFQGHHRVAEDHAEALMR
jgi:hypothetical protein